MLIRTIALTLLISTSVASGEESLGTINTSFSDTRSLVIRERSVPRDSNGNVIGGSPDGCPRVAFCGCAVALKVFGKHDRSLWKASAWFKFPRIAARPDAVAVTRRHVFLLLSHVEGTRWLAYDPNSGGHKTRVHERDIRGTTIVDPSMRTAEAR